MTLSVITTTRERPAAFNLLNRWVERQTVQPDEWLVITDGDEHGYDFRPGQTVIRRETAGDTRHSFCENWLAVIPHVTGDLVAVMEDDDWYRPDYLETLVAMLGEAELAGFQEDVYYHLPSGTFQRMRNVSFASLAATGFKAGLLPLVNSIAERDRVDLDSLLWDEFTGSKCLRPNTDKPFHVGVKGLPGLHGIGIGHQPLPCNDRHWQRLAQWVGGDIKHYHYLAHMAAWQGH